MLWRDDRGVVVSRESPAVALPDRCVRCNASEGTQRVRKRLRYAGLVAVTPVMSVTAHDHLDVEFSLCATHARSRTIGLGLLAAAIVAPLVGIFAFTSAEAMFAALGLTLVLLPAGLLLRRTVRIVDCDPLHARLHAGRSFVASLPPL
jgi:hypothetical protein